MTKNRRKHIPIKIQREVYQEAGGCCAVPACRYPLDLEIAHMHPVSKGGANDFRNLILLCGHHHPRFDSTSEINKGMSGEYLLKLKQNLMVLNNRYCPFEIRLLEIFLQNPECEYIDLLERDIDVLYLVKDELIVDDGIRRQNQIGLPPKRYLLTEKGKDFIRKWKEVQSLNGVPRGKQKVSKEPQPLH